MIPAVYIFLALLSLALSILCFGNLLASCAGHPPTTFVGIWIIPLSLLGFAVFLNLFIFFWKMRRPVAPEQLKKEAKLLPIKATVFLVSFVVASFAFFLLMLAMLALVIVTEGKIEDWITYILYPILTLVAIYVGVVFYRKLGNFAFNKWLHRIANKPGSR